jgi:putative restriction endonuclease
MHAFVGVTDINWYRQLQLDPPASGEVNFWFPSAKQGFEALEPGEFFVFKTHVDRARPDLSNRLVGVGVFSGYARLLVSEAWNWFDLANGVQSATQLLSRIEHYRRTPFARFEDPEIGCVLLRDVTFFAPVDALPGPSDFASSIVRGKRYDLNEYPADHAVSLAVAKYLAGQSPLVQDEEIAILRDRTHGDPRLIVPRVGQEAFKAVVAEAYHHHCAVTGDKVRPVLQAAHILPVGKGGQHRVDNGLLLRSDMHKLFDDGYIGFDSKYRLRVSPAIRARFGNGDWLYSREGTQIELPTRTIDRPNVEFLDWHTETVFIRE